MFVLVRGNALLTGDLVRRRVQQGHRPDRQGRAPLESCSGIILSCQENFFGPRTLFLAHFNLFLALFGPY